MSGWQRQRMGHLGQLQEVPADGVAVSSHPPGWLGKRWRNLLEAAPREAGDRLTRGRSFARRGRLRALDISPGAATAEVVCEDGYRPVVRVRPFARSEWTNITRVLTQELSLIAALLEGAMPEDLVARLESKDTKLLPAWDELSFDCDCGDFVMPCSHVATLFHVLTDALDGDPFLLLTLRGRSRDHLLSTLRADWGDDAPIAAVPDRRDEPVPEGDPFVSTAGLPELGCHWGHEVAVGAGLRALGPPPGTEDLLQTLLPLYEAAGTRIRETLEAIPDRAVPKRRPRHVDVTATEDLAPPVDTDDDATGDDLDEVEDREALTARIVDEIAAAEGLTSSEIATALGISVSAVRAELVDLLALGLVERAQDGRDVRWSVG